MGASQVAVPDLANEATSAAQAGGVMQGATPERTGGEADVDCSSCPSPNAEDSGQKRLFGQPNTLYFKLGGAPGIAEVLDLSLRSTPLVEVTMLNRYHWVSSKAWGHEAVCCGLRFLLIRLVGSRTGGPQNHNGMLISNSIGVDIDREKWRVFCQVVTETCQGFKLPDEDTSALRALLVSMEEDVARMGSDATGDGHNLQSNHHHHSTLPGVNDSSLYAQVGGMVPLAFFAQQLLDGGLAEPSINVPLDGQVRNKAALQYFFTELICYAAGGPEVMTTQDVEQTRLLIPRTEWYTFRTLAAHRAANIFPRSLLSRILRMLEQAKHFIIDRSTRPHVVADASPAPLPPDRLEDVRRVLIEKGLPLEEADALLGLTSAGPGAKINPTSKVSHLQLARDQLMDMRSYDRAVCCPITLTIFSDPVVASDGVVYERSAIVTIMSLSQNNGEAPISPITRECLQMETYPLLEKKLHAREYRETVTLKFLQYAEEERDLQPELAFEALEEATHHLCTLGPETLPLLAIRAAVLWQATGYLVPWELQGYVRGGTVGVCVRYGAAKAAQGVTSVVTRPVSSVWLLLSSVGSLATGTTSALVPADIDRNYVWY